MFKYPPIVMSLMYLREVHLFCVIYMLDGKIKEIKTIRVEVKF